MHRPSASLTRQCPAPAVRWDNWGMLPSWRQTPNLQPQSQLEFDLFCTPDRQFILPQGSISTLAATSGEGGDCFVLKIPR